MTKKVELFSGKVLKVTGTDLSPTRYKWLRLAEAEPDLGTATVDGSFLLGNTDNTRAWAPQVFLTSVVNPSTGNTIYTLNISGNIQVDGNINGIIEVDVTPGAIALPDGSIIRIGADEVLSQTTLGDSVVNSSLTKVGTITQGTWQADPIEVPWGGTGRTSVPKNAILYGNDGAAVGDGAGALGVTSAGLEGEVLQAGTNGVPTFGIINGGGWGV